MHHMTKPRYYTVFGTIQYCNSAISKFLVRKHSLNKQSLKSMHLFEIGNNTKIVMSQNRIVAIWISTPYDRINRPQTTDIRLQEEFSWTALWHWGYARHKSTCHFFPRPPELAKSWTRQRQHSSLIGQSVAHPALDPKMSDLGRHKGTIRYMPLNMRSCWQLINAACRSAAWHTTHASTLAMQRCLSQTYKQ